MTVPTEITDHEDRTLALLLSQFRDSTRLRALVEILAAEVQRAEPVLHDLITEQIVDNAVGVQLDRWGRILGLPRTDADDDRYRERLRIELLINHSRGGSAEIQEIVARLVGAAVQYQQVGTAHYLLEYLVSSHTAQATRDAIDPSLERASPSGVSWTVVEGLDAGRVFRLDSGPGFDVGMLAALTGQANR